MTIASSHGYFFNMKNKIQGHCHCKKVQFEITPPTEFCSHCHCESCRRTHGAAFVTWTSVPNNQLRVLKGGDLIREYESSPQIKWMSCGYCMSPLFQTTHMSPGRTYITVASLVDSLDRNPDSHVSYEERVSWISVNDGLPQYKAKASDRLNSDN